MEAMALTESTYYILLALYHPQHGYGIMQQTEQLSGGLHGVGASVVNALSEWLVVQVHRDGKIHEQKYTRGDVAEPLTVVAEGLAVLKHELARLQQLVANGESILKEE